MRHFENLIEETWGGLVSACVFVGYHLIERPLAWALAQLRRLLGIASPSALLRGQADAYAEGLQAGLAGTGPELTPEQQARAWAAIQQSARAATFFQEEPEQGPEEEPER